jgi:hypothetical protein
MAKIEKILGSISPLAGAVTGEGMFGKGLSKLADSGLGMLVPMSYLTKSQRDKKKKGAAGKSGGAEEVVAMEAGEGMKRGGKVKKMAKGGSVSASRRGDGIARKGKTKGRFV